MVRFTAAVVACAVVLAASLSARADDSKKDTTVTGEIVDTYCYATMGARGASHKQCGITCAKKGIPVGLMESGSNKLYVLLPEMDKGVLPDTVVNKMGETVSVTGDLYTSGETPFLTVKSVK